MSAHVVLMHLIQMAKTELQALICILMTSYTSASRCEGYFSYTTDIIKWKGNFSIFIERNISSLETEKQFLLVFVIAVLKMNTMIFFLYNFFFLILFYSSLRLRMHLNESHYQILLLSN